MLKYFRGYCLLFKHMRESMREPTMPTYTIQYLLQSVTINCLKILDRHDEAAILETLSTD